MVDIITQQKLNNLDRDISDADKALNTKAVVTPRYGASFKSLPLAIQEVIETGGFEPFETEAQLLASRPVLTKKASYALDTHNIFLWENGAWKNTGLSVLAQMREMLAEMAESDAALNTGIQKLLESIAEVALDVVELEEQIQVVEDINDLHSTRMLVATQALSQEVAQLMQTSGLSSNEMLEGLLSESMLANQLYKLHGVNTDFIDSDVERLKKNMIQQRIAVELAKFEKFDPKSAISSTAIINNLYVFGEPNGIIEFNLITNNGLPTGKGDVRNGFGVLSVNGKTLRTYVQYEVQGSSSAVYPKKNFTFYFFADSEYTQKIKIKIGDMVPHHELVYKANYVDASHVRNVASYRLYDAFELSRNSYPLRDIDHSYTDANVVVTSARAHPIGYSCLVKVNNEFYGIGNWNIGKKRDNYNLPKNNPNKLCLSFEGDGFSIKTMDYVSGQVEVRAPSDTADAAFIQNVEKWRTFANLNQADMSAQLDTVLDRKNFIDYYILLEFLFAHDCIQKNTIMVSYDGTKWLFTPYDLDSTFGLHALGTSIISQSLNTSLIDYFSTENPNYQFWNQVRTILRADIEQRYKQLRDKDILSLNALNRIFYDLYSKYSTEMVNFEFSRWPTVPSKDFTGINHLMQWSKQRIAFLDNYFNYGA